MLTKDKGTLQKGANLIVVAVAANAVIHGGAAVVVDSGYADRATTKLGLKFIGIAEQAIDNTGGADGAQSVEVRRERLFHLKNSQADPISQADLFNNCYLVDDETVAKTDGANTRSVAGRIVEIDSTGIWVEAL